MDFYELFISLTHELLNKFQKKQHEIIHLQYQSQNELVVVGMRPTNQNKIHTKEK